MNSKIAGNREAGFKSTLVTLMSRLLPKRNQSSLLGTLSL